jgi:hypothetical protein
LHSSCFAPAAFGQIIIDTSAHKVNGQKRSQNTGDSRQQKNPNAKPTTKARKVEGTKEERVVFDLDLAHSFGYFI